MSGPQRTPDEAAQKLLAAKARLAHTMRHARTALLPQSLRSRIERKLHVAAADGLSASRARIKAHKLPLAGAVAGIGLLLLARPLLNALKPAKPENDDEKRPE